MGANSAKLGQYNGRLAHDKFCAHSGKDLIVKNAFPMVDVHTRVNDGERHVRICLSYRA